MTRIHAAALAATLLAAAPAGAQQARKDDRRLGLHLEAATLGGALDGEGVRTDSAGVAVISVKADPELRGDGWYLDVPFRVAHRQTFGADLSETTGAASLEPWVQLSKRVRVGLEAGIVGANRPGWPDLYQPGRAPTDRYSYLAWRGGVQAYARPGAHQHLRARYRYAAYDYVQDAAFDEALDPMHLTPRDRARHELDASWRYRQDAWALGLRLDASRTTYDTLLARLAGTGAGNAEGVKQEMTDVEPSVELELVRMGGALELSFLYGLETRDDPYQGYYSYTGHHPRVQAKFALSPKLRGVARFEGHYLTYGANGSTRLDSGTRRTDARTELGAELSYALGGRVSAVAEAELVRRSTNYRDSTTYGIDWDYTNASVLGGVRFEL